MAAYLKTPLLDLRVLALWLATFLGAMVSTHLLRNALFPIGWNYLVLFLLAGAASTLGPGIYRWMAAPWSGAVLMLLLGARQSGYLAMAPELLAIQYLPAALTGALLGEWLRYQFSRRHGTPFSPLPSPHALVTVAGVLAALPLIAFTYAADQALSRQDLLALVMFAPGNTPFLFPSLLTAALCSYWVRTEPRAMPRDRRAALLVMALSILLFILALAAKLLFGILEVA